LINLGFEHRLQQLYGRFEAGEISLGYFAARTSVLGHLQQVVD